MVVEPVDSVDKPLVWVEAFVDSLLAEISENIGVLVTPDLEGWAVLATFGLGLVAVVFEGSTVSFVPQSGLPFGKGF